MLCISIICWLVCANKPKQCIVNISKRILTHILFSYGIINITTKLKMNYTPIPLEVSLLFQYLPQDLGTSLQRLKKLFLQYAKTLIYRHMKKRMVVVSARDKPGGRGGRPRKRTEREHC